MRYFIVLGMLLAGVFAVSAAPSSAQMGMMGYGEKTDGHTAKEEAEGKEIWEKLQAKQITCAQLSEGDFEALGEYYDSDELIFWTKGEEAFVEQDGKQTYSECLLLTTSGGEIEIVEASIDKKVTSKGVSITPLAVLEESRCPIDVVCIQAGTVRLRANLSSGAGEVDQVFKLNQKITTEAEEITLVRVLPATQSGKKIQPADYLFYFEVKKR